MEKEKLQLIAKAVNSVLKGFSGFNLLDYVTITKEEGIDGDYEVIVKGGLGFPLLPTLKRQYDVTVVHRYFNLSVSYKAVSDSVVIMYSTELDHDGIKTGFLNSTDLFASNFLTCTMSELETQLKIFEQLNTSAAKRVAMAQRKLHLIFRNDISIVRFMSAVSAIITADSSIVEADLWKISRGESVGNRVRRFKPLPNGEFIGTVGTFYFTVEHTVMLNLSVRSSQLKNAVQSVEEASLLKDVSIDLASAVRKVIKKVEEVGDSY